MKKKCEWCQKEFEETNTKHRFCSRTCRAKFAASKVKNHKCNFIKTYVVNGEVKSENVSKKKEGGWTCSHCGCHFETRKKMLEHSKEVHAVYDENGKRVIWNKGLTKESSVVVKKISETKHSLYLSGELKPSMIGKHLSEETKQKISKALTLNNRGGRSKWFTVSGQRVQGTWEREIAELFEVNGIMWEKVRGKKHSLSYMKDDGTLHHYTPDFFLKTQNLYVEVKGFWWGDDKNKMKYIKQQHPETNIIIVDKEVFQMLRSGRELLDVLSDETLLLKNYNFDERAV